MNINRKAFLDMIAYSELGPEIIASSDNGYNVLVGSRPDMLLTFSSYRRHPGALLDMDGKPGGLASTAAGRYQLLSRYWPPYRDLLKLKDFGPESQDAIALQQIRECRALDDIDAGRLEAAIIKCAHIWASLPGAGYGQHENPYHLLMAAYEKAGGVVA